MTACTIHLIDYGLGNLHSVRRALEHLGASVQLVTAGRDLAGAKRIVLPGVGAFADGMSGLRARGFERELPPIIAEGASLLGICLGAQLLMTESDEFGRHPGLGLIPGRVEMLRWPGLRVPHVGWSRIAKANASWEHTPLAPFPTGEYAYFVHSYQMRPENPDHLLAVTRAGDCEISAAVGAGRVWGLQFHPEKSGNTGLNILKAFINE